MIAHNGTNAHVSRYGNYISPGSEYENSNINVWKNHNHTHAHTHAHTNANNTCTNAHGQNKLDWDEKRNELLRKTNNDVEEIKRYVLNEKNTRITKKFIENMFKNYGIDYKVHDIGIFIIAMTHPSYTNKDYREMKNLKTILMGINFLKNEDLIPISTEQIHMAVPLGETSYERLEFFGDSILRFVITECISNRYKNMNEGDLTKLRAQIENGTSLAEISRKIGLPKYLLLPRNLEATGSREKSDKFHCDIFEAFIAAMYYDSMGIKYTDIGNSLDLITRNRGPSFDLCFRFISSLIEDEIDLSMLIKTETNHKDKLLQHYHVLGWGDPKYNVMEVIVDENKMGKKYFRMYVRDNEGNIIGTGTGSSKQKGEKIAAKKALQFLKIIPDDDEDVIMDPNSPEIYFRHGKPTNNIDESGNETDDSIGSSVSENSFISNNSIKSAQTNNSNNSNVSNNCENENENENKNKRNILSVSNIVQESVSKSIKSNETNKRKSQVSFSSLPDNLTLAEKIKLSIGINDETSLSDKEQIDDNLNKTNSNLNSKSKSKLSPAKNLKDSEILQKNAKKVKSSRKISID